MYTSEIEKAQSHIIVEIIQYFPNARLAKRLSNKRQCTIQNDFYHNKKRLRSLNITL